ncbi:MAG: TFIIB-type zinc ribbon-containing protein [Halodesulfurarchaeum sp.]
MEVRGSRECKSCGERFSYYETGSPACPACGSVYTVGVGDRELHTDRPAELDVEDALRALESGADRDAGEAAASVARTYLTRRGFINGGDLRPLTDAYVAAHEIKHAAALLDRATPRGVDGESVDREYVRSLLVAASEGTRPPADAVPDSMRGPRGLGVAGAVGDYHDELKTWLEHEDRDRSITRLLERLESHVRRFEALEGTVDPAESERLLEAARTIGASLRGESSDPEAVEDAFDSLAD